ncbi:MAG TPA: PGPGW domain-containing protein [Microthrixaceae bacterium]|nr:PGPGW domain-containing protein [Microthrixaceae bacterium]
MADPTSTPPDPDDHDERDRTGSSTERSTPPRAAELITAAVYEAERETGVHEETEAEVRRSLALRMTRMIGGFVLIGIGASLLVLPGPGWIMILIGLSLLPFAWAERTIQAIRRRVPGVPEDGAIPPRTWVMIGVVTVGAIVISFLFGSRIGDWISGTWESVFG